MTTKDKQHVERCLDECSEEMQEYMRELTNFIRNDLQSRQDARNPGKAKVYWGGAGTLELVGAVLRYQNGGKRRHG